MSHKRGKARYSNGRLSSSSRYVLGLLRLVTLLCGIFLLWAGYVLMVYISQSSYFELTKVKVNGEVSHTDAAILRTTLKTSVEGNFFTVNISKVRHAVMALPWVDRVAIRRVWPHTLQITLSEKSAVARWGQHDLIVGQGDVVPGQTAADKALPLFVGPPGSASRVYRMYQEVTQVLLPLHLGVDQVMLLVNQDWQVMLQGGVLVQLGHQNLMTRLQRLVQLYPTMLAEGPLTQIDLRYRNGLAARHGDDSS